MITNVNFIAKNNAVHNIYAEVAGVPFPAGIVVEDANENENENEETRTKGEDESTEK